MRGGWGLVALAGAVAAGALFVAYGSRAARKAVEVRLAELTRETAQAEAEVARAEARERAAAALVAERTKSRSEKGGVTAGGGATDERKTRGKSERERRVDAFVAEMERLNEAKRNDPALQRAERDSHRVQLEWTYGDFIRRLGLGDKQRDLFLDTVLGRAEWHWDLLMAAQSLDVSFYDPVVVRLDAANEQEYLATQRTRLGEAGVRELEIYDAEMKAWMTAKGLAGMATLEGEPLAREQIEAVARIISRATGPVPVGPFPMRIDIDWAKVDAEVRGVLSERQAELFRTAEAPGVGRAGARFGTVMNQVIMAANRAVSVGQKADGK